MISPFHRAIRERLRIILSIITLVGSTACTTWETAVVIEPQPLPEGVEAPSQYISLKPDTDFRRLAISLDAIAVERSAAVQEVRAAQSRLAARGFDRFPTIRPYGSLSDDGDANLGVSIQQVIWDGGRREVRLADAELNVAEASLRAWTERNEDVFEGLAAFVDISRFNARLKAYDQLDRRYSTLADLLEVRAVGGVANRGELLRMNVARQELQREIVADNSALRQANSHLLRYLPEDFELPNLGALEHAAATCDRNWPSSEPPLDAISRVQVNRSRLTERLTRAQRLPSLVLGASAAVANTTSSGTPGLSVNLDASDMLGLGAQSSIEATVLDAQASVASYQAQVRDTQTEFNRLEADLIDLRSGLQQLSRLQQSNRETVTLYEEQLEAGSIELTEGIALLREVTNTEIDILDFHGNILINCFQAAQFRGLLAPFVVDNAQDS